jgi:hypothetical protein
MSPNPRVTGWVNGRAVKFQAGKVTDPKPLVPFTAGASLKAGKNDLRLRIVDGNREALAAITTLVSPQGVELAAPSERSDQTNGPKTLERGSGPARLAAPG